MSFIIVGTNHKYSPITLRERLFLSKGRLKDALNLLREREVFKGAVILSTCNRVEVYASVEDTKIAIREIEDFISRYQEIDKRRFLPYLYIYEEKKALRHLISVACGLDSLILGETQILGQIKFSFLEAESIGFTDACLRKVFFSAIFLAKRIHRETKISEGKVCVGSVAIDFIRQRLDSLSGKDILIIGIGKVTELVLRYLRRENPNVVFVSNRTYQRARQLASQIGAKVIKFDDLKQLLWKVDVVITATASPHFVIKRETLEGAVEQGLQAIRHKLLIIDLAMPRDVDPRVKEIVNVDLFGLEDLDTVIKKNMEKKFQESEKVREIIDTELERLWNRLTGSELEQALLP